MEAVRTQEQAARAQSTETGAIVAFIRIARVKEISGLSKSTMQRWIKAGKFPRPVIQDGNSVLWDLAEVMNWRAAQFDERAKREGGS